MERMILYRCNICGNLLAVVEGSGVVPVCCGQPMEEVEANTTDATKEKHVPVIKRKRCSVYVKVGEDPHPMKDEHYIQWILLVTDKGRYRKKLEPGDDPCVEFCLVPDEQVDCAYAYCNIHGLWMKCCGWEEAE